jgi:alpha-beta hydrolase superfamily lysophospholipase
MTATMLVSRFQAPAGASLELHDWPLAPATSQRGQVVITHGLGEHAGRYAHVAAHLNAAGFAVRACDHHGHGGSDGARGALPANLRLSEDLAAVLAATRSTLPAGLPLILVGHSLGGLVAASVVMRRMARIDGLVLSSPALDAGMNPLQKFLVALLPRLLPDLRVGNGLNADFLSHDPQVVRAYRDDPLVHDRISARLARFIAEEGEAVIDAATQWPVPTLLIYAGLDRLVSPAGSRRFAAAAPAGRVRARCFEDLYHEIFNELDARPVFAELDAWLDQQVPR